MQLLTLHSVNMLGSTKVETLAAATFYELHYPMKFTIFTVIEGLCTLMSSNSHLFCNFYLKSESRTMQPVAPCVLVASAAHLDKTVVLPGICAYAKREDILLQ